MKKITLFFMKHTSALHNFNGVHLDTFVASLGNAAAAKIKFLRCMPVNIKTKEYLSEDIEVCYHREEPVNGDWWMRLARDQRDQMFAEGRTPRIYPVGKWDWETAAE